MLRALLPLRRAVLVLPFLLLGLAGPGAAAPALRIYAMDSRPISFRQDGQPDGLVVELAQLVQQRLGSHDPIEIVPWARAHTLALKEANVLLLSIVRTPEREQVLRFVGPVFQSHIAAFAVRSRAAELRARDPSLLSLRAGARRGSVFVSMARAAGYHLTDETNASENAARMLMLGRFDLWFEGEEIAGNALRSAGYQLDQVEVMARLPPRPVYFAFSRNTPEALVQAWETALAGLKRDGSFQRVHHKWLPGYELPAEPAPAPSRRPPP
ncbi:MAG: substrate-binding periplasmic protein [Sphingomonadaceae bacterium]